MLTWPALVPPVPNLPTLPRLAQVPAAYYQLVATGQWSRRAFLPTVEPTSDAVDGAIIYAFATPGPAMATPLPAWLVPFAQNGNQYFCFDLRQTPAAVRYIDVEVDQWLTVAPNFAHFMDQLQWRSPVLTADPTPQQFAQAALTADAAALPALLEEARTNQPAAVYGSWLATWGQRGDSAMQPLVRAEVAFARQYRWAGLPPAVQAALTALG